MSSRSSLTYREWPQLPFSAISANSAFSGFDFCLLRVFLRVLRDSASSTQLPFSAISANSVFSGFDFCLLRVFLRVLRDSASSTHLVLSRKESLP